MREQNIENPVLPAYTVSDSLSARYQSNVLPMSGLVGPQPQGMICPHCIHFIRTKVVYKATNWTHCIACFMFCFGCALCFWLPYVLKLRTRTDHYCPHCNSLIGSYNEND